MGEERLLGHSGTDLVRKVPPIGRRVRRKPSSGEGNRVAQFVDGLIHDRSFHEPNSRPPGTAELGIRR